MATFVHARDPIPKGAIRVVLTQTNATLAGMCAEGRRDANFDKKDSKSYEKKAREGRLQAETLASRAACACEVAVAQHTGESWNARAWRRDMHANFDRIADVGERYEVKRVRSKSATTCEVKRKETTHDTKAPKEQSRILFVCREVGNEFLEVDILGWIDADHAWANSKPVIRGGEEDPDSRMFDLDILNDCPCLSGNAHHRIEPNIELGGVYRVPKDPLNGAGADNENCISNISPKIVHRSYDALNFLNPTWPTPVGTP